MFAKFDSGLKFLSALAFSIAISVSASSAQPKSCGENQDFEMIIMLDFTGSSSAEEVTNEKDAVRAILDYFENSSLKPRIALGRFNTEASIEVPLTTNYLLIRNKLNELPVKGSGGTRIKEGLEAARNHFAEAGQVAKVNYLMLFSDGRTSGEADTKTMAAIIKEEGTFIFAIHYPIPADPEDEIAGAELMRDYIASAPSSGFYHTIEDGLPEKVREISINIGCEDGLACTRDICNLDTRLCESREPDSDLDGVLDCSDKCPKQNDAALTPATIFKDDDGDGILTCVDECPTDFNKVSAGLCGCGVPDTDADGDGYVDCLKCSMGNFSSVPPFLKGQTKIQKKVLDQFVKRIKKTGDKKTIKIADKIAKNSKKWQKDAQKAGTQIPVQVMVCASKKCVQGSEFQGGLGQYRTITNMFYSNTRTLYALLAKVTGPKKAIQKLFGKGAAAYSNATRTMSTVPGGAPQCLQ